MTIPDWAHAYFETLLELSPASRVVDIGCGHGRHALALAEVGVNVVGIDRSAALLARARELADASRAHVDWIRADMRQLPCRDECADAALIADAFGFFDADDENEAVIHEARRLLTDGGSLMMKIVNGALILADFRAAFSGRRRAEHLRTRKLVWDRCLRQCGWRHLRLR
jgi:ubiquinone/menaquinone biosynthesis C-methylase UbiE